MILYNVTINIDHDVKAEWLEWMNTKHIPDVMATGSFKECRLTKVIADDQGGETYSVQYLCENMELYMAYQKDHAPALQKEHSAKYEGKFVAFRTMLEVMQIHGQS
jgi:hypothetical protein